MESKSIDLTTSQLILIRQLLQKYIPTVRVYAHGSRVKFNAQKFSDLDMVVFMNKGLHQNIAELKMAFEESNLPFRVDLLIWDEIPTDFHSRIMDNYFVLQ